MSRQPNCDDCVKPDVVNLQKAEKEAVKLENVSSPPLSIDVKIGELSLLELPNQICWICRSPSSDSLKCISCPRIFHPRCLSQIVDDPQAFICFMCETIFKNINGLSASFSNQQVANDNLRSTIDMNEESNSQSISSLLESQIEGMEEELMILSDNNVSLYSQYPELVINNCCGQCRCSTEGEKNIINCICCPKMYHSYCVGENMNGPQNFICCTCQGILEKIPKL